MLLAYRLVKLIESHSDGLARSLHNFVIANPINVPPMPTCLTAS